MWMEKAWLALAQARFWDVQSSFLTSSPISHPIRTPGNQEVTKALSHS